MSSDVGAHKAGHMPKTPTKLSRKPQLFGEESPPGLGVSKSTKPRATPNKFPGKPAPSPASLSKVAQQDDKDQDASHGAAPPKLNAGKTPVKKSSPGETRRSMASKTSHPKSMLKEQEPEPIDDSASEAQDNPSSAVDQQTQDDAADAKQIAMTDNSFESTTDQAEVSKDDAKKSDGPGILGKTAKKAERTAQDTKDEGTQTPDNVENSLEKSEDSDATYEKIEKAANEEPDDGEDGAGPEEDHYQERKKETDEYAQEDAEEEDAVAGATDDANESVKIERPRADSKQDDIDTAENQDLTEDEEQQEEIVDASQKTNAAKKREASEKASLHEDDVDVADESTAEKKDASEAADALEKEVDRAITSDLSVLKGLEVDNDGMIHDREGKAVGKLVDGDAEDLAGYEIGEDGEILDEDGDLVGRCELVDEESDEAEETENEEEDNDDDGLDLPGVEILEGLTCDAVGNIYDDNGDTIGQIVEGEPRKLKGCKIQTNGEILDKKGNVIGRAEVYSDISDSYRQQHDDEQVDDGGEETEVEEEQEEEAEDDGDAVGDVNQGVDDTLEEDEVAEAIEEDLPSIAALEGKELNAEGQVVDADGNILGELREGEIEEAEGLQVNEQGEVLDEEGNVVGKVEIIEGAADKLAAAKADLRILEGLKVNRKGKILDEEGEVVGELIDGEVKECVGKKVNEEGEVMGKDGDVLGRVKVVPGEAADVATQELLERFKEMDADANLPGLETLEGLKVNKKGLILNEDGEPIGELVDGELSICAGKKCNDKGEVLGKNNKVIGRVKTLAPQDQEEEEEGKEEDDGELEAEDVPAEEMLESAGELHEATEDGADTAEEAAQNEEDTIEDDTDGLPPLSVLEGLKVNKAGKLINGKDVVVGELVEGDAKKLSKAGTTCDAEGQFWDNKGHVVGRAQTVAVKDAEEEAPFAGLEGLIVNKGGYVEDENGNVVGVVVEGNAKKLIGRAVDEDGDIIDKRGSVVGHADRYEEEEVEAEPEPEAVDLSFLAGKPVNKQGNVIGDEGVPVARLAEGSSKECSSRRLDKRGQLWNDRGDVIGRVELIPEHEREAKPEGPFAGLEDLRVAKDGQVVDEDGNVVGTIVEGNAKRLVGLSVDEDGDVLDKYGNVKGHAEPVAEEDEPEAADLSILEGKMLNKQGFVIGDGGIPIGRLAEGNVKELSGRRCDEKGQIHGDTGKVVGRCDLIPENERVSRAEGPFAGYEGLHVIKGGWVADEDDNIVGQLVEGNAKRLVGHKVDEDGDIIDKYGSVKGHAEPYEEEEAPEVDLSALAGCKVNKAGNVVNDSGTIIGRVAEGDVKNLVGRKVDGQGQIWNSAGKVIGKAELAENEETNADGPFAGFDSLTIVKDGSVVTASGDVVGRVDEGDIKKLVGHHPDPDGDVTDRNGNVIGHVERWELDEKERRVNPMSGLRVNKEGEIRDQNGDLMGQLTSGDLGHCTGLEVDDNGYVIDNDGNKVGEVTLMENIAEEEQEIPEEEMTEEQLQRKKDSELADKMTNICQQTLERVQPICRQITEHIEAEERKAEKERNEDELVNKVKPLIEEGGRILEECNGSLRALDPDGHIAAEAKARSQTKEAAPSEHRLAEVLKEITQTIVKCIDDAKKRLNNLPSAKRRLNPLFALLTEPLFQILAAVGLLLTGVLGLVGQLLSLLGLGGIVNGLLGGLGIKRLLGSLGLGDALGLDGKPKKKSWAGNIPIVGGLLGKKKD